MGQTFGVPRLGERERPSVGLELTGYIAVRDRRPAEG
jgi:hypothetical protein